MFSRFFSLMLVALLAASCGALAAEGPAPFKRKFRRTRKSGFAGHS